MRSSLSMPAASTPATPPADADRPVSKRELTSIARMPNSKIWMVAPDAYLPPEHTLFRPIPVKQEHLRE